MKITLLGDSIRLLGYGTKLPELLGKDFEVYQPTDNCRFIKYTMRGVGVEWREAMRDSRIVHWNNGIWDTDLSLLDDGEPLTLLDEYRDNAIRLAKTLLSRHDRVIFATTTPLHHDFPENRDGERRNKLIAAYNAAVVPPLSELGVVINDLHSLVYPKLDEYLLDDKIHLNEAGILACATQTADIIRTVAKEL